MLYHISLNINFNKSSKNNLTEGGLKSKVIQKILNLARYEENIKKLKMKKVYPIFFKISLLDEIDDSEITIAENVRCFPASLKSAGF